MGQHNAPKRLLRSDRRIGGGASARTTGRKQRTGQRGRATSQRRIETHVSRLLRCDIAPSCGTSSPTCRRKAKPHVVKICQSPGAPIRKHLPGAKLEIRESVPPATCAHTHGVRDKPRDANFPCAGKWAKTPARRTCEIELLKPARFFVKSDFANIRCTADCVATVRPLAEQTRRLAGETRNRML